MNKHIVVLFFSLTALFLPLVNSCMEKDLAQIKQKYLDLELDLNSQGKCINAEECMYSLEEKEIYDSSAEYKALYNLYSKTMKECQALESSRSDKMTEVRLADLKSIILAQPFDEKKDKFAYPLWKDVSDEIIKQCVSYHIFCLSTKLPPSCDEILGQYRGLVIDVVTKEMDAIQSKVE